MKLGIIGIGNMATAIVGGIIKNGILQPDEIIASRRNTEILNKMKEQYAIAVTVDNKEVVEKSDIIMLAVKPQFMEEVIKEIKDYVSEEQIIISLAPGKTIQFYQKTFGKVIKIARCMPNTPALVGEGCTGICFSESMTELDKNKVFTYLQACGKTEEVSEQLMDVVVAVSGSSPAYVFLFVEAMADAAVLGGMPRKMAYEFAAQAVLGSAKMILETGKHPGELKDMVCSPGGTTIEAVKVLEETGMRASVMQAMSACIEKSKKL